MYPRTDIISLVHNQLSITKQFIEHIFQNTDNFNLIFVDNASTDGTHEFLLEGEEKNKWKVIRSDKNLGVICGRNLGIKYITCNFFLNIDNDQLPGPGWLQKLHDLIEKGYDLAGCEAWLLCPPKTPGVINLGQHIVPDRGYWPLRRCTKPSDKFLYLGGGGTLIKREVYEKIGLFDERYNPAFFEDPDFAFRCIQAGFKLGWCYDCPINHLAHQTIDHQSLFQKHKQLIKSWLEFRKKWKDYYPPPLQMPQIK